MPSCLVWLGKLFEVLKRLGGIEVSRGCTGEIPPNLEPSAIPSASADASPMTSTSATSPPPSTATVLRTLSLERLFVLGREFGARLRASSKQKRSEVAALLADNLGDGQLPEVLRELSRDELRAVCRAHGLPAKSHVRDELLAAIATASGLDISVSSGPRISHDGLPEPGCVLAARGRQWLVESVARGAHRESPLLKLACLDDDAPGRSLEILWDLEIGARVIEPEADGLGVPARFDPPASFGAYLHALKWSAVSAADARRFQAPFRAGIKLMNHQLTPLMKALTLPRANLFIADDVGLGKTIEAGLVLQELILRQQAGFVLIVCPASVSLQWRDEMMRRFGLRFEVMSRNFVAYRRRERGFGVNPWATHNRFIVSYPLIRRPEYRDPLLAHLGRRAEKGLLILDEAHVAAPAAASKYAVDSETTSTVRDLAPKFDNRLFLSATPHNGHSNSFSALLEILDPIRFTRGVPVSGVEALAPVMVRRLKRDLRRLGVEQYPRRILARVVLDHDENGWGATVERLDSETGQASAGGVLATGLGGKDTELKLAAALADYTKLCAPASGRGRLVFINLQKRLLSSPAAFARTLDVHIQAVKRAGGVKVKVDRQVELYDPETHGVDDDSAAAEEDAAVRASTEALPDPTARATELLGSLKRLADEARSRPDAKLRVLMAWMRQHMCSAIFPAEVDDSDDTKAAAHAAIRKENRGVAWTDCRVIIFTEYGHTKTYLQEQLSQAIAHTDRGDERLLVLHGGMGDEGRDEVQRAFNSPPADHPVRILLATDAAREGINLQAFCADLFHFDVPWNPSRLEQRNGRIDRTLQPADEVRCHYFVYRERPEDRVLNTLMTKIATVQRELGSVGAVLLGKLESVMDPGIDKQTEAKVEAVGTDVRTTVAESELEAQRQHLDALEQEIHRAGELLERSKRALDVEASALRGVVDIGLGMAGAQPLREGAKTSTGRQSYILPELDRSWQATLDTLRPPRGRDEAFWEWREKPPRPVTFEPLDRLGDEVEQLHLAHPLVKRILDRFLAQGFGAHDLTRTCGVVVPGENVARVIAYARLTLFGPSAARLHDELIAVAAAWPKDPAKVKPYKRDTEVKAREVTEQALAAGGRPLPVKVAERVLPQTPAVFAGLWPFLRQLADTKETDARNGLKGRAVKESDELRQLLERQREAIAHTREELAQTTILTVLDKDQRRQVELDLEHMELRESQIGDELTTEPKAIEALYQVHMTRLTPVGLVVAWPEAMT